MKILLPMIVICLMFGGCRKNELNKLNHTPKSGKLVSVKFNVKGFDRKYEDVDRTSADPSPLPGFKHLYFFAFSENNYDFKLLEYKEYSDTSSSFGNIYAELPTGTLRVAIIASVGKLTFPEINDLIPEQMPYLTGEPTDILAQDLLLDIGSSGVVREIALERVVGQVEAVLTDTIPFDAKEISMKLDFDATGLDMFSNHTTGIYDFPGFTVREIKQEIKNSDYGKANYRIGTYVFKTGRGLWDESPSINITLKATLSNGAEIAKYIPNAVCLPNRKLVLSGKLFEGAGKDETFVVSSSATWEPELNKSF